MTKYNCINGVMVEDVEGSIGYTKPDTDSEINNIKIRDMKSSRNSLLAETDWMANSDVTMSDAWKTYRQALRDLPAQSGFPDVDFPTKPS